MNSIKGLESVTCGGKIVDMMALREEFPEKFNKDSGQMDYEWFEKEIRPNFNIYVRHDVDSISFTMMTKPMAEGGKGCQFTDLIEVALHQLEYLNGKFPCDQNEETIVALKDALHWQEERTKDRFNRGVEGLNEA